MSLRAITWVEEQGHPAGKTRDVLTAMASMASASGTVRAQPSHIAAVAGCTTAEAKMVIAEMEIGRRVRSFSTDYWELIGWSPRVLTPKQERARFVEVASRRRRSKRLRSAVAIGTHTHAEWVAMLEVCGFACLSCGIQRDLTKDHVKPICDGGSDAISNLQPLCLTCNSRKGGREADYRPAGWAEAMRGAS